MAHWPSSLGTRWSQVRVRVPPPVLLILAALLRPLFKVLVGCKNILECAQEVT